MSKEILEITKRFHDTYENLSKEYGYETREDTKLFNVNSNNGMLMYATVNEVISPILNENQELKKQLEEKQNPLKGVFAQVNDDTLLRDCGNMNAEINGYKTQQKEFIKFLEDNWKETQDIWYIKILNKYKEIIVYKDA